MKQFIFLLALVTSLPALSAFKGEISFSSQEIREHEARSEKLVEAASNCLQETYDYHLSFHRRYGISPFYGDQSSFAKLTYAEKKNYLRRLRKDPKLVDRMETISCVGYAMRCLKAGFEATGQAELWARLLGFMRANALDGTALQFGLRKLGWKTVYWNPDLSMNESWDEAERARNPQNVGRPWGWHSYRWYTIRTKGMYYDNPVDDFTGLVDFGTRLPEKFTRQSFFLGTAHTGYHVFPGRFGQVLESHSLRKITDVTTIETSPFNPLLPNGGPQGRMYSGLFSFPPGSW